MGEPKAGKHVIFLGAGASISSGYPLGRKLRLLMTSPDHLFAWLKAHIGDEIEGFPAIRNVKEILDPFAKTIGLFREGAYASVDEFGMIARGQMQKEVQELKRLMSFVLAMVNPRWADDSAYFPFVNALFRTDSPLLRDDVCILTFNYDPHLEFVISRARALRLAASGFTTSGVSQGAVVSGFSPDRSRWHEEEGFFLGKLHGTIATEVPTEPHDALLTFREVFDCPAIQRLAQLSPRTLASNHLPVVFPWELLNRDGFIRDEGECNWNCYVPGVGYLRDVMQKIWGRAVREVETAKTISFVGLSMHHYLVPGFSRLFRRKEGEVKIVVANPDIRSMDPVGYTKGEFHQRSSIRRIRACLQRVAPNMNIVAAPHYLSFEEFIEGEVAR